MPVKVGWHHQGASPFYNGLEMFCLETLPKFQELTTHPGPRLLRALQRGHSLAPVRRNLKHRPEHRWNPIFGKSPLKRRWNLRWRFQGCETYRFVATSFNFMGRFCPSPFGAPGTGKMRLGVSKGRTKVMSQRPGLSELGSSLHPHCLAVRSPVEQRYGFWAKFAEVDVPLQFVGGIAT